MNHISIFKSSIRPYFANLSAKKFENLDEKDNFLHKLIKINHIRDSPISVQKREKRYQGTILQKNIR